MPYGGKRDTATITSANYHFTDQEWEPETGLYNYDARLYDPVIGRFVSADMIVQNQFDPQMLNRFAYVRGNPLKYVDPSGHRLGDGVNPDPHDFDDNPGNWNSDEEGHYRNKKLKHNSWKEEYTMTGNIRTIKKHFWSDSGYQRSIEIKVIIHDDFDLVHRWEAAKDFIDSFTYERANIGVKDMVYNSGYLYTGGYVNRFRVVETFMQSDHVKGQFDQFEFAATASTLDYGAALFGTDGTTLLNNGLNVTGSWLGLEESWAGSNGFVINNSYGSIGSCLGVMTGNFVR